MVALLLDQVFSVLEQCRLRRALLEETDNEAFAAFQDAILTDGDGDEASSSRE